MTPHEIEALASRLLSGKLSLAEFTQSLATPTIADVGEAQLDLDRGRRCGFPEVVFAEGKMVETMARFSTPWWPAAWKCWPRGCRRPRPPNCRCSFRPDRYNPIGRRSAFRGHRNRHARATAPRRPPAG